MNMFCYQCQETGNGKGCTTLGICGKTDETANLQDLLIYLLQGLSFYAFAVFVEGKHPDETLKRQAGVLVAESLFATITNTNFDPARFLVYIDRALRQREAMYGTYLQLYPDRKTFPDSALWSPRNKEAIYGKSLSVGVLEVQDADVRSVKETITYGLKGMSAYAYHAANMGFYDDTIFDFLFYALSRLDADTPMDELLDLVLETGKYTLASMDLLDKMTSAMYGNPVPTKIDTGVRKNPGILVTGHDLRDLEHLLRQTENSGVDVYTNGEMVLAQSLPYFRQFPHFAGNYGNAWWQQGEEFRLFNGAILVTSNCIIPVEKPYAGRIFTTSVAGYPGVPHIGDINGAKDFSAVIAKARTLPPPAPLNEPGFMSGFGHHYLGSVKDKVIELVKAGKIKRFVVMGGCDGRDPKRDYYVRKALSYGNDTVILTAGCAKYRFIKKVTGEIEGIPRVLDAGQCSDNYSFLVLAKELALSMNIKDLNQLPIEFDIAWYDQKAVAILLVLLYLGIKKIKIGPTLPEFLTQYLVKKLKNEVEITTVYDE